MPCTPSQIPAQYSSTHGPVNWHVPPSREKEFELYKRIARLAPSIVKNKKGKVVCTNVDFYSGFVYRCMGIPKELFTPIFAMARVAGWAAHRIEEIVQGRIIRPSYVTSLKGKKNYVALAKR